MTKEEETVKAIDEAVSLEQTGYKPIEYIWVNDDLWKVIGSELLQGKVTTFKSLYNANDLRNLQVYNKFELVPSHTNYRRAIETEYGINFNVYKPLTYKPEKGEWKNIDKILRHLAGDNYDLIMEWLWLTYKYPERRIISLAFVGGRNSGKTSFLHLLSDMLQANFLLGSPDLITSAYNEAVAGRIAVGIDEKVSGKEAEKELQTIKRNMSSKDIYINPKNKSPYVTPNYVRYVFCSNDVNNPLKLESENERILVIDVPRIKDSDDRILQSATGEMPAFTYYLENEFEENHNMIGDRRNRFWFPPSALQNQATRRVQDESRPGDAIAIQEIIIGLFEDNPLCESFVIKSKALLALLQMPMSQTKWVKKVLTEHLKCEYAGNWTSGRETDNLNKPNHELVVREDGYRNTTASLNRLAYQVRGYRFIRAHYESADNQTLMHVAG